MASPTPNRALTYPAHGGAVGAWDAPLNADFDNLDLAFGTYNITIFSSVVVTTFNATNATVPSTAFSLSMPSSIALNFHYPITGAMTGGLQVVFPAVGGFYDIRNNTSGVGSLTATVTGSAAPITLVVGGRTFLVADGVNMYFASDVFGDITVNSVTAASSVGFKATGTAANLQQSGTTAQRPAASAGLFRYNSDIKDAEFSDPNIWRPVAIAQPMAGAKNLIISSSAAASTTTQAFVTADAITVESTTPISYRSSAISMTVSSSFNGAGGLDAGGLANNTFYALYTIYSSTGNTYNGLLSTSFSAPALPAGYDCTLLSGAMRTDGAATFYRILQRNRNWQYVVTAATNTTHLPIVALASAAVAAWTAVPVSSAIPPTASILNAIISNGGGTASMMAAPNNSYDTAVGSFTNPPPVAIQNAAVGNTTPFSFVLESNNIYWSTNTGSTAQGPLIAILGAELS